MQKYLLIFLLSLCAFATYVPPVAAQSCIGGVNEPPNTQAGYPNTLGSACFDPNGQPISGTACDGDGNCYCHGSCSNGVCSGAPMSQCTAVPEMSDIAALMFVMAAGSVVFYFRRRPSYASANTL